jgi:hypothetical protein
MDYSASIPEESKTLVVVPTLIGSAAEIEDLVETMEVRYLANKQEHLYYAMLTDFRDADVAFSEEETQILSFAQKSIEALNSKYRHEEHDIFFLFHRPRKWNAAENTWMGYERKRGKLDDLMSLLRGRDQEQFQLIVGDLSVLKEVKYLLTLDTDTQLPREAAWKIIGTMAHPLNHAHFDEVKKRVTQGYGILQPRLGTSITESSTSWYAKLHASEEGIDPYTRTVSDVYQDTLGEGSYIGKGIIDIDAFQKAIGNRLPENRILSHDLLEGCHARSGLISDVQLYEDYPSSYLADMKRRHRWIRGDWQIARWLMPKVPGPGKSVLKNPLSTLSRWKIADNLRRSLAPPAHLLLFLFGWLISPTPWFWTLIATSLFLPAPMLSFVHTLFKKPKDLEYTTHLVHSFEFFVSHLIQILWLFISLPYEAFVNTDAILRTWWRILISRKNLLQWDPFRATQSTRNVLEHFRRMWFAPVLGLVIFFALPAISIGAFIMAMPILIGWMASPLLAWAISLRLPKKAANLTLSQLTMLRKISRKTWAYFDHFVNEENHFLPPDNYQEYPSPRIAQRTSPTNIGISLISTLAAYDFGYISLSRLLERSDQTLATIVLLDRYKGHLYNWYDTESLRPMFPRYVSTVDSGNLAASLLILKEGLLSLKNNPVITAQVLVGIQDTLIVLLDKKGIPDQFRKLLFETEALHAHKSVSILEIKHLLDRIKKTTEEFQANEIAAVNAESQWWLQALHDQCKQILSDIEAYLPFLAFEDVPESVEDLLNHFQLNPTLHQLSNLSSALNFEIGKEANDVQSPGDTLWFTKMKEGLEQ